LDAVLETAIDDAVVEVDSLGIARSGAVAEKARPAQRQALGLEAERGDQSDVFGIAVIEIDGDVADRTAFDASTMRRCVPHRRRLAVDVPGAFDLKGGRSDAEGGAVAEV